MGRSSLRADLWKQVSEGRSLLLTGPAGVGKTRLAHALLEQAEEDEWFTQLIAATPAVQPVSFGAVHELLSSEELDGVSLMNHAIDQINERAKGRRRLVVVDDMDKLDLDSLALVDRLARDRTTTVVATVRAGGMNDERVGPLWKDEVLEVVDVEPLDRVATDELAQALLNGPATPELLDEIWDLTEGNALFLREVLLGAKRQGRVAAGSDGRWEARERLASTNRLFGIISNRLASLSAPELDGMVIIACSEPIALTALDGVVDGGDLETLEAEGFIQVVGNTAGRLAARMAHPMIGEVLREGSNRMRKRSLLGALSENMLGKATALDPDNRQRALVWALDAGVHFDHELLLPAAERALFRFDSATAAQLAEPALDFVPSSRAAQILCRSLLFTKRHDEVATAARRGMALAETEEQRCDLLIAWADNEMHGRADPANGIALLRRELPSFDTPEARSEILIRIVVGSMFLGEVSAAIQLANEHMANDALPKAARVHVTAGITYAMYMTGQVGQAFRSAITDGLALTSDDEEFWIHNLLFQLMTLLARQQHGHLTESREQAANQARDALDASEQGGWGVVSAFGAVLAGDGVVTAQSGASAARLLEVSDPFGIWLWVEGIAALGMARSGDVNGAADIIESSRRHEQAVQGRLAWALRAAHAWTLYQQGEEDAAFATALSGMEEAAAAEHVFFAAVVGHEVVRLGRPEAVVDSLEAWAAAADSPLMHAYACHARALVDADCVGLEDVGRYFSAIGAPALAAEALVAGADCSPDPQRSLRLRTQAQAAAVLVAWEHAATLTTAEFPLSERELQIAAAAADGKANKEIAADLFLSFRTVGNHLQTVYKKLGISAREELRPFIVIEPPDAGDDGQCEAQPAS